jgi:hypothetical protein
MSVVIITFLLKCLDARYRDVLCVQVLPFLHSRLSPNLSAKPPFLMTDAELDGPLAPPFLKDRAGLALDLAAAQCLRLGEPAGGEHRLDQRIERHLDPQDDGTAGSALAVRPLFASGRRRAQCRRGRPGGLDQASARNIRTAPISATSKRRLEEGGKVIEHHLALVEKPRGELLGLAQLTDGEISPFGTFCP